MNFAKLKISAVTTIATTKELASLTDPVPATPVSKARIAKTRTSAATKIAETTELATNTTVSATARIVTLEITAKFTIYVVKWIAEITARVLKLMELASASIATRVSFVRL